MRKLKILRIIARLNIGGPAIHTTLLTREFDNDEFESRLVCGRISRDEGDMSYLAGSYGIEPVYVPTLKRRINPLSDLLAFCRIFMLILKYKPDIVHTHTAKAGVLGRAAAILAGVPVKVHTFHGNIFQGYFDDKDSRLFLLIERFLAGFSDAVITVSKTQKEDIVRKYSVVSSEKCHVITLGFDLEKFLEPRDKKRAFRNKFNFKDSDILIGIVGRFAPIKNHKMLINTIEFISKHANENLRERIKFIIVGDGRMKSEILAYSRFKGVRDKILFTGWVKETDELYAGLDIVVLTSMNEGTPVSLIEAMASSRPVVATEVGGVKDTIGRVGSLVESGNYKAMAEKLLELAASSEKREDLGRRGRELVKGTYSKERLTRELGQLYKDLISQHRTGRKK